MPPEDAVLNQENLHRAQILATSHREGGYELLFDSFIQSVRKGIRGPVISARQLLFRIDAIFVDVEIGCEANSNRASLIGQMLDSLNPGRPPAGVSIFLLDRGRNVASTLTNDNGEFQFQFVMKSDLKLSVAVNHSSPVYLPISNPLRVNVVPSGAKRQATRVIGSAAGA